LYIFFNYFSHCVLIARVCCCNILSVSMKRKWLCKTDNEVVHVELTKFVNTAETVVRFVVNLSKEMFTVNLDRSPWLLVQLHQTSGLYFMPSLYLYITVKWTDGIMSIDSVQTFISTRLCWTFKRKMFRYFISEERSEMSANEMPGEEELNGKQNLRRCILLTVFQRHLGLSEDEETRLEKYCCLDVKDEVVVCIAERLKVRPVKSRMGFHHDGQWIEKHWEQDCRSEPQVGWRPTLGEFGDQRSMFVKQRGQSGLVSNQERSTWCRRMRYELRRFKISEKRVRVHGVEPAEGMRVLQEAVALGL